MVAKLILRIREGEAHFRHNVCDWLCAFWITALGCGYLSNPGLFQNEAYRAMLEIGPQPVWGTVITFLGLMRIGMLWLNGRRYFTPYFRVVGALLSILLWFILIVTQVFVFNPPQARFGWIVFIVFEHYNLFNAARDAGFAYQTRKEKLAEAKLDD